DASMRMRSLETSANGTVLQGALFDRDRTGDVLALRDVSDPARGGPSLEATFEYDAWSRLTRAAFGTSETLEMEYDLGDRVLRRESSLGAAGRAHVGAFEYDAAHPDRVVRAGERTYRYDAAGHVIERGATALEWDFLGRLSGARTGGRADGT